MKRKLSRFRLEVINLSPIFANAIIKDVVKPEIFRIFGFRFMFYANDHEPIHVHVAKGGATAKFTLFPVELVKNNGLKPSEVKIAEAVIEENQEIIARHWNMFFNKTKQEED